MSSLENQNKKRLDGSGKKPIVSQYSNSPTDTNYSDFQGISVIRVTGTPQERARQHGQILKERIRNGVIPVLADRNQWLIRRGPGIVRKTPIHTAAVWVYENLFVQQLLKKLPPEHVRMMKALAKETQIPEKKYLLAMFQPDGLLYLSKGIMKHLLKEFDQAHAFGCSSAIVPGSWTQSGKMLVSRNLDYPIAGPWERNTTVIFHEPKGRSEIPHVALTSAGVHTAGLTSMNQKGLTLSIHAHFSKKLSYSGVPGTVLGDAIISKAETIGQAVDIARKIKTSSNWAFAISSAREKTGAILEITPTKVAVRQMGAEPLTHTNFFQSPELKGLEGMICGAEAEDLVQRLCRMQMALQEHRGSITPATLCSLMGNHVDASTGEERVLGNTLSVITTVSSVIFEPEDLRLWVATRNESPVGLGNYVRIDAENFWKSQPDGLVSSQSVASSSASTSYPSAKSSSRSAEPETLPGYAPRSPRLKDAISKYREAYQAWHLHNQEHEYEIQAFEAAKKAAEIFPSDGHLWIQAGILGFKTERLNEAYHCFHAAQEQKLSVHLHHVCELFLGRYQDLRHKRALALRHYRKCSNADEPELKKAAKKGLRSPYRKKQIHNLALDLQFPDALRY